MEGLGSVVAGMLVDLADALVKSAGLLVVVLAGLAVLRRTRPAVRAAWLQAGLAALLVLPVLGAAVPGWSLRVMPAAAVSEEDAAGASEAEAPAAARLVQEETARIETAAVEEPSQVSTAGAQKQGVAREERGEGQRRDTAAAPMGRAERRRDDGVGAWGNTAAARSTGSTDPAALTATREAVEAPEAEVAAAPVERESSVRRIGAAVAAWWPAMLAAAYGAGVLFLLARTLVAAAVVMRLAVSARGVGAGAAVERLLYWRERIGVRRRVRLVTHPEISVPTTLGWFSKVIAVQPALLEEGNAELLDAALVHELAHLKRRDLEWSLADRLAAALYWPNPLIWITTRKLTALRELACDDWSASALGRAGQYCESLRRIALMVKRRGVPALGASMARRPEILERLARLAAMTHLPNPHLGARARAGLLIAALALAAAIGSGSLAAREAEAEGGAQAPMLPSVAETAQAGPAIDATSSDAARPARRVIETDPAGFEAALAALEPGDTLMLADGEYGAPTIRLAGEEGAPITIKAKGDAATFTNNGHVLRLAGSQWVVVEGIWVTGAWPVADSPYCTVRKCLIESSGYGISAERSPYFTIEDCEIRNVKSNALRILAGSEHAIVRRNRIHDCQSGAIHLDSWNLPGGGVRFATVEGNVIWNTGAQGGAAINATYVHDSVFRNNVLYKNLAGGFAFYLAEEGWTNERNTVVGNTVYFEPGEGRWAFKLRDKATGFVVKNNIFLGGSNGVVSVAEPCMDGLVMDYNIIKSHPGERLLGETWEADAEESFEYTPGQWRFEYGFDRNSKFEEDPIFASVEKDDYRPAAGSPAIDAGTNLAGMLDTDIAGTARPQGAGFDIGAYEFAAAKAHAQSATAEAEPRAGRTIEADPATLAQALEGLGAGDTVLLADGEYAPFSLTAVGAENAPVTIRAKGTSAVVKGGTGTVGFNDCRWVVAEGFRVEDSSSTFSSVSLRQSQDCIMRGLVVKGGARSISLTNCARVTVEGCDFSKSSRQALRIAGECPGCTVRGNAVHDNDAAGIFTDTGGDVEGTIRSLTVEGNTFLRNGGPAMNLMDIHDSVLRNNVIAKNGRGGIVFHEGTTSRFSDGVRIVCNTIYSEPGAAWYGLKVTGGAKGFVIRNNVIVGGSEGALAVSEDSLAGLASDHNLLFAHEGENLLGEMPNDGSEGYAYSAGEWRFEKGHDVNSKLDENPLFVSLEKDDYRLRSGSPAIGLGADLGDDCRVDITGAERAPGGFDAGAYDSVGAAAEAPPAQVTQGRVLRAEPSTLAEVSLNAGPGDTVLLADGEYERISLVVSGAEGAPVTFKAEGKEAVFRSEEAQSCITLQGVKWIVIDGIRCEGTMRAVYAMNATDCVLRNLTVTGATGSGIGFSDCSRMTVENCDVSGGAKFGIRLAEACDSVTLRGNRIRGNGGGGIHIFTSDRRTTVSTNIVIEGNVISGDGSGGGAAMNICAIQDSIIRNNLIYKCTASGICFYSEAVMPEDGRNARNKVIGNTVYVEPGVGRTCLKITGAARDIEVYNNVFYGGFDGAYAVTDDSFEGLKSDYNLIANHEGQVLFGESSEGDPESYSYETGAWRFEYGFDRNSVLGEAPLFASIEKDDYRLAAGSPGIDAGADMSAVCAADITGAKRPQGAAFDMGAYEAAGAGATAEAAPAVKAEAAQGRTLEADPSSVEERLAELRPGDTLLLADGEYRLPALAIIGAAGAPITIRGKGQGAAMLPGAPSDVCLHVSGSYYLVIENLKCTEEGSAGVFVLNSTDCTIRGCQARGINVIDCPRTTIEGNTVSGAPRHGISVTNDSTGAVIRGNRISGSAMTGIWMSPQYKPTALLEDYVVEDNVIIENLGAGFNASGLRNAVFRNNVVAKNGKGAAIFFPAEAGNTCVGVKVVGNTFYQEKGQGWYGLKLLEGCSDFTLRNNIFIGGGEGALDVVEESFAGLDSDYNAIYAWEGENLLGEAPAGEGATRLYESGQWRFERGQDTHSLLGTQIAFASAAEGDFRPAAGSAVIDAGAAMPGVLDDDISGTARPQGTAVDIGAYEVAAATAPVKATAGRTIEADPATFSERVVELRPGDTLLLADGEYEPMNLTLFGEEGAPITIKAKGANCSIRLGEGDRTLISVTGSTWLCIEGINCPAEAITSVYVTQSTGCTVRGSKTGSITVQDSPQTTIEDNDISGGRTHGLRVINDSPRAVVCGNHISGNGSTGLYISPQYTPAALLEGMLVEDNVITGNTGAGFNASNLRDSIFRNNVIVKNGKGGAIFFPAEVGNTCAGVKMLGNTFYQDKGEGFYGVKLREGCSNFTLRNNIFVGGQEGVLDVAEDSFAGLDSDYNVIFAWEGENLLGEAPPNEPAVRKYETGEWRFERGLDVHSIINTAVKFASVADRDFRPAEGSVVIDAGADLKGLLDDDISGAPRPQGAGFDIGAYEYVGAGGAAPAAARPAASATALELTILDAITGGPVGGAALDVQVNAAHSTARTDDAGRARVEAAGAEYIEILVAADGRAPVALVWDSPSRAPLPEKYRLRLARAAAASGVVTNPGGSGIEGATVTLKVSGTSPERYPAEAYTAKTDAEGRWSIQVPEGAKYAFEVSHPEYQKYTPEEGAPTDRVVLQPRYRLTGTVVDGDGKPLGRATVVTGDYRYDPGAGTAVTDEKGAFSIDVALPSSQKVTAGLEGYAAQTTTARPGEPARIVLERGSVLKGRIVDWEGQPLSGVAVRLQRESGKPDLGMSVQTGPDGRFEVKGAPDAKATVEASKQGYIEKVFEAEVEWTADVRMAHSPVITGAVTDAETAQPVEKFRIVFGQTPALSRQLYWRMENAASFENGRFEVKVERLVNWYGGVISHHLRVEAKGYEPAEREIPVGPEAVTMDFVLKRAATLDGVVVKADGTPAAGVKVVVRTARSGGSITPDHLEYLDDNCLTTDEKGEFFLSPQDDIIAIAAATEEGGAEVSAAELEKSGRITLVPWGSVEGVVKVGTKGMAAADVGISVNRVYGGQAGVHWNYGAKADAEGRFSFKRVLPGNVTVNRQIHTPTGNGGYSVTYAETAAVEVKPGETTQVTLGGHGRPVVGRLRLPAGKEISLAHSSLSLRRTGGETDAQAKQLTARMQGDGSFRFDNVDAGSYEIQAKLLDSNYQYISNGEVARIEVPEAQGGVSDEAHDLGLLRMREAGPLVVGEKAPEFAVTLLDGTERKLGDFEGKAVIVHFWSSQYRLCRRDMPEWKKVWEARGRTGEVAMLWLSTDTDAEALKAYATGEGLEWPVALVGSLETSKVAADFGVSGIPQFFVLGLDGVVTGSGTRAAEADGEMNHREMNHRDTETRNGKDEG